MPSLRLRHLQDASLQPSLTLPAAFLLTSVLAFKGNALGHSLLSNAGAWLLLCVGSTLSAGFTSLFDALPSRRLAWAAGGALVLAQLCERAVEGRYSWWAKALSPILIFAFVRSGLLEDSQVSTFNIETPTGPSKPSDVQRQGSLVTLVIVTTTAFAALYRSSGSIAVLALCLCYSLLLVAALYTVERAVGVEQSHAQNARGVIYSANRLSVQPVSPSDSTKTGSKAVLVRDVSVAAFVGNLLAAVALESWRLEEVPQSSQFERVVGSRSKFGEGVALVMYVGGLVVTQAMMNGVLLLMVQRQGAFLTSLIPLSATVVLQVLFHFSIPHLWFSVLYAVSTFLFLKEQDSGSARPRTRTRGNRILALTAFLSLLVLTVYNMWPRYGASSFDSAASEPWYRLDTSPPLTQSGPLRYSNNRAHPIQELMMNKQTVWDSKVKSQSQTLEEAVKKYKQRYGLPPPPHFDKWFFFATQNGVQMIDEYDTIYHSLLPFWALSPATIRGRAREALGNVDNQLMGLTLRDGKAVHAEGGPEWLQKAVPGMLEQIIQYLPDMDLAFNLHDEPRVVVPHDELSRLVRVALTEHISKARENPDPKNSFSPRPKDLNNGMRIEEAKQTRFNVFAHQPTWIPSRMSCSPDTPARAIDESVAADNLTAYSLGELGFIYNHTAFTDVCNSPSFSRSHGFFDRPNAFNLVHELFPIFSQSKISSYQDILFPSPWYWDGRVSYDEEQDMPWEAKNSSLWWRGSTTGGFSRDGGWRRQHRQQLVAKLTALDTARVYEHDPIAAAAAANPSDADRTPAWRLRDIPRPELAKLIDVHFTYIGQCDETDCKAQEEYFDVVEPAGQQEAWGYKYLLDMDGNAFSGRFYAFLASRSQTFKMAVFREWHEEWIQPWVHYVPLSLRADEALEAVRFFDAEDEGRRAALDMAEKGREWAGKALRNVDFEAWFFRLLLEYGRVIDDNRESIGFVGPY